MQDSSDNAAHRSGKARLGPVLVVDDDRETRDLLGERLQVEGFPVDFAASGEEALARYLEKRTRGEPYQFLTLDIRMPGLNGRQLLKLIRLVDREVCILMISALDDLSQAVQSLSQGADDYLGKPIKIWDIRDRLTTALGRRRSLVSRRSPPEETGLVWGTGFSSRDPEPGSKDQAGEPEPLPPSARGCREPAPRGKEAWGSGPLEALLHLAGEHERTQEGMTGHGRKLSRVLSKLGAFLAGSMGLESRDLDALCLAARLHSLGTREASSRQPRAGEASEEGPRSTTGLAGPCMGQEREDLHLAWRMGRALLDRCGEGESASTWRLGLAILEGAGRRRLDVLRYGSRLERTPSPDREGGEGGSPSKLALLEGLFETADLWIHLSSRGLGGFGPEEALSACERSWLWKEACPGFPRDKVCQALPRLGV